MPRPIRGTIDVHTHKDGLRTYYLRMTVDGRRERERLGTDREGWTPGRALVALEERLEAVRAGTWKRPQEPRVGDDDPTFRSLKHEKRGHTVSAIGLVSAGGLC